MNVKLRVLSAGVLFFMGQSVIAQKKKPDTIKTEEIKEVVILGYSRTATKAKDVTSSTTVTAEKFENRPTTSFLNSLQGESPGLTINSASGSPGSSKIDVIIRGIGSLSAGSEPLYVIDGIISNATQFRNINDSDIESASVLRDAAATSIYGNRASNGVIVISTKRGRFNAPMKFSYSASTGINTLPKNSYNLSDAKQYLQLERAQNVGVGAGMTDAQINNYPVNTNWRKVFFNPGFTQRHDVSMTVGGKNVNLYSSLGYMDQKGNVPTSDFKRFTFRNNLSGKSENDRFTYNAQVALGYSVRHQLDEESNSGISNNTIQNPLHGANNGLPYLAAGQFASGQALYNSIGTNFNNGNGIYVLEDILKGTLPNERTETSILANLSLSYKLTDNLTLANKVGIDYKYSETNFARAPWSYLALAVSNGAGSAALAGKDVVPGFEDFSKNREFNIQNTASLVYNILLGEKHDVTVGAYMDYSKVHYNATAQRRLGLNAKNWVFGAGTGYSDPIYFDNGTGAPIVYYVPTASASQVNAGALAYFATLDYDYDGKYGLSGLVRRDGSYRFIDENKWGTFWSVGARWNIDQESFMTDSVFNLLKLRASYGLSGNQNIIAAAAGVNPLLVGTNLVREVYATGTGYDNLGSAVGFGGLKNPLVQWEEQRQANIGLDITTFNRRLDINLDVYEKTTDKLYNQINLSAVTGSFGIQGNNGKLQNRGVELNVKYKAIKSENFNLNFYANTSYNKSEIKDMVTPDITGANRNVIGGPVYQWFLSPYLGVNQSNGNSLFQTASGAISESLNADVDGVATGKTPFPDWQGGFGLNSDYKGFYLNTHFTYQQGAWKYDNGMSWLYDPLAIGSRNVSADLLDAWTPTNTGGSQSSLNATNLDFEGDSDKYLKDASFVRLKNVTLGYNLSRETLRGTFVKSMKIFVQAENLVTFTKWKGYDPEPNFFYSLSVYPNMKTISLGTNIEF